MGAQEALAALERVEEILYWNDVLAAREPDIRIIRAALEESGRDAERLGALHLLLDGVLHVDLHEQAGTYASVFAREEPNADDYLAAARDAMDALLASECHAARAAEGG